MGEEFTRTYQIIGQVHAHANIVLFDDLEGYLRWTGSGDGSPTIQQANGYAYHGTYGLGIITDATWVNSSISAQATRPVAIPKTIRLQLALFFRLNTLASTNYVRFSITYDNGTYKFTAAVQWQPPFTRIQVQTSAGTWASLSPTLDANFAGGQWVQAKLSVNFTPAVPVYISCQFGDYIFDLSDHTPYIQATANVISLDITAEIDNAVGVTRGISLDDVLVHII